MSQYQLLDALHQWQERNVGYPSMVRCGSLPNDLKAVTDVIPANVPLRIYGMEIKLDSSLQPGEFGFMRTPETLTNNKPTPSAKDNDVTSNPTNPEQVDCPRCEGDGLVSVDTVLPYGDTTIDECPDCGGTGKVAAKTPPGYYKTHALAPAPVDQPDELEREIEGLIALWENQGRTDEEKWAVRNFFTGAGLMIPKIVDRIVARKEATAARQARADLGQKAAFGGKANVYGQVIHLAGQGHTGAWIGSWAQRQLDRLAALDTPAGEETSQ